MSDITNDLLILLIEVVIKTHDYENLTSYKERLNKIKAECGYNERCSV